MKSIHRLIIVALLALPLFLLTACSSTNQASFDSPLAFRLNEEAAAMAVMAVPAAAEESASQAPLPETDRKIVSTVNISLVVEETDATLAAISALVDGTGGYIAQTNLYQSYQDADQLEGSLTLRVPAEALTEALAQLSSLAVKVESQSMNRQDVTDQYVDLQARLRNLEATEEELRSLLAEVRTRPDASVEDILDVHRSLTQIRGEIEQLQGRINLLDNTVALSTITVNLRLDVAALPIVDEGWRPGATLTQALRALTETMQQLGNLAIWWGVYLLPIALILATPIVIGFFVARWLLRRHRQKQSRMEAA